MGWKSIVATTFMIGVLGVSIFGLKAFFEEDATAHVGHEELHANLEKALIEAKAEAPDFVICGTYQRLAVRYSTSREVRALNAGGDMANGYPYSSLAYHHCEVVKFEDERWKETARRIFLGM